MARRPAVRPDASQAAARPSGTGAEASPAPDASNASNASNAISEAFVGWRKPTVLWVVLILLVSAEAAHEVLGLPGPATLYESWIHCSVILAAAALCLARGARDRQSRGAWLALGSGMLCWGAGRVYPDRTVAYPSRVRRAALLHERGRRRRDQPALG